MNSLCLIIVHFEVHRLRIHIPDRAGWVSCILLRFARNFTSAKAKGCNSLEEVLCLSPQCCVQAHKEERVDQAVHEAKVECAGVSITVILGAQIDDGGPPANKEGQCEEGEDKGHVDPLRPLCLTLHHLA